MTTTNKTRCLLLSRFDITPLELREAISAAVTKSRMTLSQIRFGQFDELVAEILKADLVLAIISESAPDTSYEIGLAHAIGRPVLFLIEEQSSIPGYALNGPPNLLYSRTSRGLSQFQSHLSDVLRQFKRAPREFTITSHLGARTTALPAVDLDQLEPREFENLCFELLTLMGFKRVDWGKQLKEFDVVATSSKKDPDGFDYDELWLISLGQHTPLPIITKFLSEPDFFYHRLTRSGLMHDPDFSRSAPATPLTILLIQAQDDRDDVVRRQLKHIEQHLRKWPTELRFRVRLWERQHLVDLIHQFPQLIYKYFTPEPRGQSKFRKSYEQLYIENSELTKKNQATIVALEEERDKRARAERDAVWKDVAFKAAHKLGNPIFALETNLQGLKRKIVIAPNEAIEIADEMDASIEKSKSIIDQFKSLAKSQQIVPQNVDIFQLISSTSRVAKNNDVSVDLTTDEAARFVVGDPVRISECFDELFANALHWFDKPTKTILISISVASDDDILPGLDKARKYAKILFSDNGRGIPVGEKSKIFSPFFTTYPHGTGLGLSVVQRVVEGHGGSIREAGKESAGAMFEIILPLASGGGRQAQ